jgi:tetratricopeptide (TPR) repeat protein
MRITPLIAVGCLAFLRLDQASAGQFGGGRAAGGGGARAGGAGARQAFQGSPSFSGANRSQFANAGAAGNRSSGGSMVPHGQYSAGSGNYQSMANRRAAGAGASQTSLNRPGAGGSGQRWQNAANWANRPGAGGSGERWPNAANRPDWANRPAGGAGERWPNADNRPNWSNQNGNWNRSNNWVNNGNINRGNTVINNNFTRNNVANNRWSKNYINRPWGYNYYHSNWSGWHSGCWNNWGRCPAAWYTAGVASGVGSSLLWGTGPAYVYSNPFYVASPAVITTPALDYSQPVQVPAPVTDRQSYGSPAYYEPESEAGVPAAADSEEAAAPSAAPEVPPEAARHFEEARQAFKPEDYERARKEIEQAIELLPKDATLHEFRALVLFAQGKYRDAAAGIYAVLAVGPGWNWQTMSSLYANPDTYTKQLRALETYVRSNAQASDGHFLLAYHYLVIGSVPDAITQLKDFQKLVPTDQLAPELIKAFTESPDTGAPKAEGT